MLPTLRNLFRNWFRSTQLANPLKHSSDDALSSNSDDQTELHADLESTHQTAPQASLVANLPRPYDGTLLERASTQWQFGDWQSLARLNHNSLQHHPERAKLALLAAAGRLQTGQEAEVRQYIRLAQNWGASKRLISQILIAGVHNSIGRAAAIGNEPHRSLQHFEKAITIGAPCSEVTLLTQARSSEQLKQLGLAPRVDLPYLDDAGTGIPAQHLSSLNSTHDSITPTHGQKRSDKKNQLTQIYHDLNRVRNERNKLQRENQFLHFVINTEGSDNIYALLEKAKPLMLSQFATSVSSSPHTLSIQWIHHNHDSWLHNNFGLETIEFNPGPLDGLIDYVARLTNSRGPFSLWKGYEEKQQVSGSASRTPNQVRIGSIIGSLFTWITRQYQPNLIVEVGTAFGVSGMYWAAGLELNSRGRLITFEPNDAWQPIAEKNINLISSRFKSILGTVEQYAESSLGDNATIDILFIDAIHTDYVVRSQLEMLKPRLNPGALVLIDDINFSDDMRHCWKRLSVSEDFPASVEIKGRIGILEYAGR